MAAEPEQPLPSEQPKTTDGERPTERFGPLELLRTSKSDGRALLLFSRRELEQDA